MDEHGWQRECHPAMAGVDKDDLVIPVSMIFHIFSPYMHNTLELDA